MVGGLIPPGLAFTLATWMAPLPAVAEIIMDGSMGPAAALVGPDYAIPADLGTRMGGNLFHSFALFTIGSGESATFSGPDSVTAIIARVTGGQPSTIDGLLRSTIPGADLFLINPAGIVFGQGSHLDVGGSFYASTADSLTLNDGGIVHAYPESTSIVTAAPPSAFGFLEREEYGTISNTGLLEVAEGETISLVGGDIYSYYGTEYAPAGHINLVAAASPGEAVLEGDLLTANSFTTLGDITLRGEYRDYREINGFFHPLGAVDVSGASGSGTIVIRSGTMTLRGGDIMAGNYSDANGGVIDIAVTEAMTLRLDATITSKAMAGSGKGNRIAIKAGSLDLGLEDESYYTGRVRSTTEGWSTGNGGDIAITADSITIDQFFNSDYYGMSRSGITSESNGDGRGGAITINAGTLELTELGEIRTTSSQLGNGGDILVTAEEIAISGQAYGLYASGITSEGYWTGKGGDITIASNTLALTDSGLIGSYRHEGSGRGGDIAIAADSITVSGMNVVPSMDEAFVDYFIRSAIATVTASSYSSGAAGDLAIDSARLTVADAGTIVSTSAENGWGQAGDIGINAREITVSGHRQYEDLFVRSNIGSETLGYLAAGDITIATGSLTITDAGHINTNAWQGSLGDAGTIDIDAETIDISGYGQQSGFFPAVYQSGITSESFARGTPGDIAIRTNALRLANAGVISTSAAEINTPQASVGDAGNIAIDATDVEITGFYDDGDKLHHSAIFSDSWGYGDAGSITLAARHLALTDLGTIRTNTWEHDGNAGDITISGDSVQISGDYLGPQGLAASGVRSETWSDGDAGTITMDVEALTLADSGNISTDTRGAGHGGDIALTAKNMRLTDRALISSNTSGAGAAGDITMQAADRIALSNSTIATAATTDSSGNGGSIAVRAKDLTLADHAAIDAGAEAEATGNGGNIDLALSRLHMDQAAISAKSAGSGTAGYIAVHAGDGIEVINSTITTSATDADGGNIEATAGSLLHLDHGAITTSVMGGEGNGGNIAINPRHLILDHGKIIAQAYGGNGGSIHIKSETFIQDPTSVVSASSTLGIDGIVTVDSPNSDVTGAMTILSSSFLDEVDLAANRCTAQTTETSSSLVMTGREGSLPGHEAELLAPTPAPDGQRTNKEHPTGVRP